MKSMNHKLLKLLSQRNCCVTKAIVDPCIIILVGTKNIKFCFCRFLATEYLINVQEDSLSLSHLGLKCDPKNICIL